MCNIVSAIGFCTSSASKREFCDAPVWALSLISGLLGPYRVYGFRVLGFRDIRGLGLKGLGFRGLGCIDIRGLGFRGLGFRVLGFRGSGLGVFELRTLKLCSARITQRVTFCFKL